MLRCYHRIDNGLEMSCCPPDKKQVFARFRFHFNDGLFTGQNYTLRPSDFAEEMEGFALYCSRFIGSISKSFPDTWIVPKSEYVEYNLDLGE